MLSQADQYNEWVMTSIRKKEGISKELLKLKYASFEEHFHKSYEEIPKEYLIENEDFISLSRQGLLFADFVGSMLFSV